MFLQFGRMPDGKLNGRRVTVDVLFLSAAVAFCLLFAADTHSQPLRPLTLLEAEDLALAAEPGQLEFQARAAALKARATVAGELPDPVLRLGLNNYPFESGGFSTEGMTHAALGVRQVFPAGKTRSIAARQFDRYAEQMTEIADARGRSVLAAVRVAWAEVYFLDRAQALLNESRPYLDDLATITRSLYAVGRKSQQDVLRAELELSRLDDRLIDVDRQQGQARATLRAWIGDEAVRPVAESISGWAPIPDLQTLDAALAEHPLIRASDAEIAAAKAGVDLANERSKPDWALDLGYSYREGTLPSGQPRSDFVSLNVTIGMPFFRKKSVDGALSAALAERSAATAARRKLYLEMRSQAEAEWSLWRDLSRRIDLFEDRMLTQSESHAEATLLAYQSDEGDFAEVMRAYVDDLDIRVEYLRLRVMRAKSYAVIANLGGLQR